MSGNLCGSNGEEPACHEHPALRTIEKADARVPLPRVIDRSKPSGRQSNTAAHRIDPSLTLDIGLFEQNCAVRIRAKWGQAANVADLREMLRLASSMRKAASATQN